MVPGIIWGGGSRPPISRTIVLRAQREWRRLREDEEVGEGEEEEGEEAEGEGEARVAVEVLARVREDRALHVQKVSGACSRKPGRQSAACFNEDTEKPRRYLAEGTKYNGTHSRGQQSVQCRSYGHTCCPLEIVPFMLRTLSTARRGFPSQKQVPAARRSRAERACTRPCCDACCAMQNRFHRKKGLTSSWGILLLHMYHKADNCSCFKVYTQPGLVHSTYSVFHCVSTSQGLVDY